MPQPLVIPGVGSVVEKAGRKIYRDVRGRFISRAKFELSKRRDPISGRFTTTRQASYNRGFDAYMRAEVGRPNGSMTWVQLADKYPDNFEDYIDEFQARFVG